MPASRRTFTKTLGSVAAATLWWDRAVADVATQGALADDTVRALLETAGGAGIFTDAERLRELRAALERAAVRLAALRAFPVPSDLGPATIFTRHP